MATHTQTNSAKVLAFPAGGRRGLPGSTVKVDAEIRPIRPIIIDAWYHQAAVAEDEQNKNH